MRKFKPTKMIYIASSYTCRDKRLSRDAQLDVELLRYLGVTQAIGRLQDKYPYAFIGPITQSHHTANYMKSRKTTFDAWRLRDLTYISRCDELWILTDKDESWRKSKGVTEEVEFAMINDIPIKFIDWKTYKIKPMRLK